VGRGRLRDHLLEQDTQVSVTGCKPAIHVVSHDVKGKTAISELSVAGTGKLVATAKGLSKGTGKIAKVGTVTVPVALDSARVLLGLNLGTVLSQNRHIRVYYVTLVAVACGSW
jgi:hypothetical protein